MRAPSLLVLACLLGCGRLLVDVDGDGTVLVACVGDSNTAYGWPDGTTPRWCELAGREPHAASVRRGLRAVSEPLRFVNLGVNGACACRTQSPNISGMTQVDRAVAAGADILVIALGTTDVVAGTPAAEIVDCYRALVRAAAPREVFVALTPPMLTTEHAEAVDELNTRFRAAFSPRHLLDFHDGYERPDFRDYLHFGNSGQAKRAMVVLAALAGGP